ncbi:MAG: HTTM domain-containing protein [Pirellulaceae bacterium]
MSQSEGYSLVAAWQALARGWNRFFHAPQDTRVCAAVRIAQAAVLLVNLAFLYPDLNLWYTDGGVLPSAASREMGDPFGWSLLWHLPATRGVVHACFWVLVGHTVLLLLGFCSRINAMAVLVWLISFQNRNEQILDGEDFVMRVILVFLILMPGGWCWSVDAWLRRWRSPIASASDSPWQPAWGLRLLQIQMATIYFSAGLWKAAGASWIDGTALYYVARLDDYFGKFPTPAFLFDTPWLVALITWSVVLGELLVPLFIWFRETRRLCLVAAILFHLANEYTMHLFLFHWAMLAGWLAFVRAEDFAWLAGRPRSNSALPLTSDL